MPCPQGYDLSGQRETVAVAAVGERPVDRCGRPQITANGLEARPGPGTLVTMTDPHAPVRPPQSPAASERLRPSARWRSPAASERLRPSARPRSPAASAPDQPTGQQPDRGPFRVLAVTTQGPVVTARAERLRVLQWVGRRCVAAERHLLGVDRVTEDADGAVVVERPSTSGVPLPAALDRIGCLSTGVAVTLTLPLLDLAHAGAAGALDLGAVQAEDVLVDDAGAPVVVDRVPGEVAAGPCSASDGVGDLVTVVRTIWDHVDPSDPHRPGIDAAASAARHGDVEALAALVVAVRTTSPPRPVRWEPVPSVFDYLPDAAPADRSPFGGAVTALVERLQRGIPLGRGRVLRPRVVLSGICVVAGLLVVAGVLGDPG